MFNIIMRNYLKSKKIKIAVMIILSVLFALYLWGDNLSAKFGLVDDHEIIAFLGADGKVKLNEIGALLIDSEVGTPGVSLRYRPSFYFIRIFEAFLWGNSPLFWYGFRLVLFAGTAAIFWVILNRFIGFFASMFFLLYVFSMSFWADIWARLGSSETYAVFGVAIYCMGIFNLLCEIQKDKSSDKFLFLNWSIIGLGAIISMGSKENFLILIVPSAALFVFLLRKHLLTKTGLFYSLAIFGYGIFISTSILVALSKTGKDVYENRIDILGRLQLVYNGIRHFVSSNDLLLIISAVILAISIISCFLLKKDKGVLQLKAGYFYIMMIILIALIYVSQYVFYNGEISSGTRYEFPAALCGPLLILVAIIFLLDISQIFYHKKIIRNTILLSFSLLLVLLINHNGYSAVRNAGKLNALQTQMVQYRLSNVVRTLKNNPESYLVFRCYNPMDAEPVLAASVYLRAYKIRNPFFLKVYRFPEGYSPNNLEKKLMNNLSNISVHGGKHFISVNKLNSYSGQCYSLSFSKGFLGPPDLLFSSC